MRLSREQFVRDAWALEGKPFLHQGTDPDAGGLDCIHAPVYLMRLQGLTDLPFEMPRTYRHDSHDCRLIEDVLRTHLIEIPESEARAADLYLFRPRINMRHIGIRLTDDKPPLLLHPSSQPVRGFPAGRISVEPFSDRWPRMLRGCFRLPYFEDEAVA